MKQCWFEIKENRQLADGIWQMVLAGDTSEITAPGQFVNIKLEGHFLRRPISVKDVDDKTFTIVYKVLGQGTSEMTKLEAGEKLDILTGLGNGYDLSTAGDKPLLIGGGVGIPPLYLLAKELIKQRREPLVVLGYNNSNEMFLADEFKALGCEVIIATADGSFGIKGFVTDAIKDLYYTYFYTCGPEAMLKAVHKVTKTSGQLSFEERMGCGFGACMGCSCKTVTGYKRICKDGPVLKKEEVLW